MATAPGDDQMAIEQPATLDRGLSALRLSIVALVLLGACEIAILQLYVGAVQRVTDLKVELEYARGSAMISAAQAQRCISLGHR
jgi:hypothetical protein